MSLSSIGVCRAFLGVTIYQEQHTICVRGVNDYSWTAVQPIGSDIGWARFFRGFLHAPWLFTLVDDSPLRL
jgi:hypothetical protein